MFDSNLPFLFDSIQNLHFNAMLKEKNLAFSLCAHHIPSTSTTPILDQDNNLWNNNFNLLFSGLYSPQKEPDSSKDIQLFNKEVYQFQEIRFQDSPRSNLLSISPSSDLFSKVEFVDFPRPVDEINCTENKFSNKIQDKEEELKESHIKQHNNDQTLTTNINQNNEDDEDLDIIDVVGSTLVYGKEYKKRIEHRNGCVEFGRLVKLYSKKETKKNIKCSSCKDSIPNSIVNIRSHVHKHVNSPLYSCKVCQVAYKEQYQVYEHIKEKHDGKMQEYCVDLRDMQKLHEILIECFPGSKIKKMPKRRLRNHP